MKEIGRYDRDMQQFVEAPKPVNMAKLIFQRWLVDNKRGEHEPVSAPAGEFALAVAVLQPIADRVKDIAEGNIGRH